MNFQQQLFIQILCIIMLSQVCVTWGGWFFSSDKQSDTNTNPSDDLFLPNIVGAEFALETLDSNEKAMNLLNNAKLQMRAHKSCWVNAYSNLFAGCSRIVGEEDLKDRLTWDLSDCFQKHSGRTPFPHCNRKIPTKNCLQNLDGDEHKVYLQYFLQIDSICHQLQIHAFKHQTERLVNELKRSAEYAEEKLENIEGRGKLLLQNSKEIHGSLSFIDLQTQQVAQTSKEVQDSVSILKDHSEEVYKQSKGIAESQEQLIKGQQIMRERLDEGLDIVHDSYHNLGKEIDNLKNETVEIEKEIGKVGEEMFSKMTTLQSKADDIESITGLSLDKQKELLSGQVEALDSLQILTKVQSKALEESRSNSQQFAEFWKKQQEELLLNQEQFHRTHNQLAENSKTILAAQEAFESKQAKMLTAIEKLFTLHNAMLVESRAIKLFIIYCLLSFVIYMFTSMKQTYNMRTRLFIGLGVAFFTEFSIIRFTRCSLEHQAFISNSVKSLFVILALAHLIYAICTYRDYEILNHEMLLTLIDKVNQMQGYKQCDWEIDEDSEVNWLTWVDEELPDVVDKLEDPDYILTEDVGENSAESKLSTKIYNLRNRHNKYINY